MWLSCALGAALVNYAIAFNLSVSTRVMKVFSQHTYIHTSTSSRGKDKQQRRANVPDTYVTSRQAKSNGIVQLLLIPANLLFMM